MFLDFLFRKKELKRQTPPAPLAPIEEHHASAPGTHIGYNPDLVPHLHADHVMLAEIFTAIGAAFHANDLAATVRHMNHFRMAIQAHLLSENVRLYIYLEHALARDAASHALIHEFRHEMDGIGKAVLTFLGKYRDLDTQPNLAVSFGNDLAAVGKVLVERIEREESTLYPLYLPAY
ncbi:MAG: hemerythrin domain-containing protein [Pseudomonadota bacterium]|nr:hemerythrin domain-containing protein [Pseudomonadota bacterium]